MTGVQERTRRNGASAPQSVPPHDLVAEAGVLGLGLLHTEGVDLVASLADDFYGTNHGHIASAIARARTPDVHTVATLLERDGLLGQIGGDVELVSLLANAPATAVGRRYAQDIREHARRRRQLARLAEADATIRLGGDPTGSVAELLTLLAPPSTAPMFEDVADALDRDGPDDPTVFVRSDGQRLFYPQAVHSLFSEPSVGKTTVAGMAVVQEMEAGHRVVYLDYEDILPRLARRLLALDVSRLALLDRFHYARPGPLDDAGAAALVAHVADLSPTLVVVDGVAEALTAQGLDEGEPGDIARFYAMLCRPLAATGAAVVLLDHVAKDKEGRGRWARGSGHKLAAIDGAAYTLTATVPFSRHRSGRLLMTIAKDRPGAIGATGDVAAVIRLEPIGGGQRLVVTIDPSLYVETDTAAPAAGVSEQLRSTVLEVVSKLSEGGTAPSRNRIAEHVRARKVSFRDAVLGTCLASLEQDGKIVLQEGPNNSHLYSLAAHQPALDAATS